MKNIFSLALSFLSATSSFAPIYDITGRVLQTIAQQKTFTPGTYNIQINLNGLQPGIYFVQMQGKTEQQTLRLIKNN